MPNPSDERQLDLLRRNIARIREHAVSASDALYAPGAECPEPWRALLVTYIADADALSDIHALNPHPQSAERFWARVRRPESSAKGMLAPHWYSDHARVKQKTGTLSIPVVHWRGRMRPVSHVAFELLRARELLPDEKLKRLCDEPTCANIDQHYRLERRQTRTTPLPEPLLEVLGQAVDEIPMCRNGHHLAPGKLANNCSQCRAERRKVKESAKAAAWRATYYGEIGTGVRGPEDAPEEAGEGVERANGASLGHAAGPADPELDELNEAIRAMFEPIGA